MSLSAKARVVTENKTASRFTSGLLAMLAPGRLVWLVVLIGGLFRLYRFNALSLWVDEGLSVLFQRLPWDTVLGLHGAYDTHPPLYYAVAKAAMWFAPELTAGRLVSVVAGTLTLPIVYALGARLIGKWGGLLAAAALALAPLHVWYSQEARPYALAMLVVALCYMALVAFYQSLDWRWAVLYGVTLTVSLYTDLSTMYALAPQAVLLVYMVVKKGKRALWIWLAGFLGAAAFLPWVPQILKTTGELNGRQDGYLSVALDKIGYSVLSIMGVGGQASYFWGSQMTSWERWPSWQIIMIVAIMVVWATGIAALWRLGHFSLLCALSLFAGTIVVGTLLSLISAGYAERTVIYGLLGWVLIVGAVLNTPLMRGWRWASSPALGVVALLSMVSLWAVYSGGDKQHWRELAAEAEAVAKSGEKVVMYPEVSGLLLDLYYPGEFDLSLNISDYGKLPDEISPDTGTNSVWLAYIETGVEHEGGLDGVQAQLVERGYERVEHHYFWNPLYLDHYVIKTSE